MTEIWRQCSHWELCLLAFYKLWVAFFGGTWYTIVNLLMQRGFGMAQFRNKKPFGKYTPFICFLLLIAGLEFFALAGFLLSHLVLKAADMKAENDLTI